jgi:hypothetical protein
LSVSQIKTTDEFYGFISRLKSACQVHDARKLCEDLDHALKLGSSGLEIMGAVMNTIVSNRNQVEHLLGSDAREQVDELIAFVDRAFGRRA